MVVSIHALFSHNDMIGSKIISKGTKHLAKDMPETSHVALLVNNRWVHEATGSGVHIKSYDLWNKTQTEVDRVKLNDREYKELADQFRKIQDKEYDYPGVLFLALCIIPTFVGLPLPKKNLFQSRNKFFCCEVVGYLTGQDYSMHSPIQILKALK
jgi:hypothetical protein